MSATREYAINLIKELPDDRLSHVIALLGQFCDFEGMRQDAPPLTKGRKLGGMEGKIWMSDDFNEPLECFEEYMP